MRPVSTAKDIYLNLQKYFSAWQDDYRMSIKFYHNQTKTPLFYERQLRVYIFKYILAPYWHEITACLYLAVITSGISRFPEHTHVIAFRQIDVRPEAGLSSHPLIVSLRCGDTFQHKLRNPCISPKLLQLLHLWRQRQRGTPQRTYHSSCIA